MKALVPLAACVTVQLAAPAAAEPPYSSEHARVGLLAEIGFAEGSSRLPEAYGSQLGWIAAWADENFDGLIVLDGHADHRGLAAHDLKLSLRRARIVRDQLISLGVDPNQIIISVFDSEQRPRARVAVWGTRDNYDAVVAKRRRAHAQIWAPNSARPSRTRHR
jgi:outer membrane protein OmpA-like peptidoglycan-associated protein